MRAVILGNAGAGKSTLARWLAARSAAAHLDLDTVAWEPGPEPVAREPASARAAVADFCRSHERWVVEGCYASLAEATLPFDPHLVLLDPGEAQCIAHCRARPWEPHKYDSPAAQHARLPALLDWVRGYYSRDGEFSLAAHRALFDAYPGRKRMLTRLPWLALPVAPPLPPAAAELLDWLG